MLESYDRICSYLCLYIPHGTGAPSVDHMIAKSIRWDQVYEWRNYRLACSLMNARKGAVAGVLDPFDIEDGWFALELYEFQVLPGEALSPDVATRVDVTIDRLRLNDLECCKARSKFTEEYWQGHIMQSIFWLAARRPPADSGRARHRAADQKMDWKRVVVSLDGGRVRVRLNRCPDARLWALHWSGDTAGVRAAGRTWTLRTDSVW